MATEEAWLEAYQIIGEGDYLRALSLVRRAVEDANPSSYDPLAYLLEAGSVLLAGCDQARIGCWVPHPQSSEKGLLVPVGTLADLLLDHPLKAFRSRLVQVARR